MTSLSITFIFHWPRSVADRDSSVLRQYGRFVEELERYTSGPIRTLEHLHDAPSSDFIIFAGADARATLEECSLEQQASLTRRFIPLNASRHNIFEELLEPLSIPAAIDSLSLLEWETSDPGNVSTRGLHGLRDIGNLIGSHCLIFESERYCFLESTSHNGLPHLLADYLTAFIRHDGRLPT